MSDNSICNFCNFGLDNSDAIAEYKYFWVVNNLFAYNVWDSLDVEEHLMIVPKRHVEGLAAFNSRELSEYVKIVAEYEGEGFSFYGRTQGSAAKSVSHQHSHLFKLGGKNKKISVFVNKPYLLIAK